MCCISSDTKGRGTVRHAHIKNDTKKLQGRKAKATAEYVDIRFDKNKKDKKILTNYSTVADVYSPNPRSRTICLPNLFTVTSADCLFLLAGRGIVGGQGREMTGVTSHSSAISS